MAEPYVAIADHTTYAALATSIEITTNAASSNATALAAAQTSSLASQTAAQALVAQKFDLFFLVGA